MKKKKIIKKISKLSSKRYGFIDKRNQSWDEEKLEYKLDYPEIDKLGLKIEKLITKNYKKLPFEFIFDELTKLGQAPNLLYDDNGHFCITGDGIQTVNHIDNDEGKGDVELIFKTEKEEWFDTIQEALYNYLKE